MQTRLTTRVGRKRNHDTDSYEVTLLASGKKISANRHVLAAKSDFFKVLLFGDFREKDKDTITLEEVPFGGLKGLVDYAYKDRISCTKNNVCGIYATADYLCFEGAMEVCHAFMLRNIKLESCLEFWSISLRYCITDLESDSRHFICRNFAVISSRDDFLNLPSEMKLLFLQRGDLSIKEYQLALIVCNIIEKSPDLSRQTRTKLINCIRVTDLSTAEIQLLKDKKFILGIPTFRQMYSTWLVFDTNVYSQPSLAQGHPRGLTHLLLFADDISWFIEVKHGGQRGIIWKETQEEFPLISMESYASVQLGRFIYVIGGTPQGQDTAKQNVFRLDSAKKKLIQLADMNTCRRVHSVAVLDQDSFIVVGGLDQHGNHLSSVEKYSISDNKWHNMNDFTALTHHAACNVRGKVFLSGGYNAEGEKSKNIHVYEATNDAWTRIGEMHAARSEHSMCCNEGLVLMIGGNSRSRPFMECFDTNTCQSSDLNCPTRFPCGITTCIYDGIIYIVDTFVQGCVNLGLYIIAQDKWVNRRYHFKDTHSHISGCATIQL